MTPYEFLRDQLWPRGDRPDVWAIADCARDKRIYNRIRHSGLWCECLFSGALPPNLERASPHLVQLIYDDPATRRFIDHSFGNSWGVYFRADLGPKTVRKHLRTILRVMGPNGRYLLFRYWDPRVMRAYLPTCLPDELERFWGPIEEIWTEGRAIQPAFLRFRKKAGRLIVDEFAYPSVVAD